MWSIHIRYLLLLLTSVILNSNYISAQDVSASINTKKSLNIVDNKFISMVIDPLILMSGLNISLPTLNLAKHFSPAFIRIQGFSTPQIMYSDELNNNKDNLSSQKLTVTSSMWTSLNEWLISTNLTPVFALSDRDRVNDAWNPKSAALPLMVMADKMNMTCFWELNNDTPNKSLKQYADDITSLRHILDAFPGSRDSWGIVGGELGQSPLVTSPADGVEMSRKLLKTIESTVDAVVWSPVLNIKLQYPVKVRSGVLNAKKGPAIWTTAPRSANPSTFDDALNWGKNLGQAAGRGYNVIFRQPKINELFQLTPAYWVSLFHKHLMGRNVLDIRSINYNNKNNAYIFAHCTKHQNKDTKKGGVTVFVVNMENEPINITAKFLGINLKDFEIQSYVLTSPDEDQTNTYLNGELLTISDLQENKFLGLMQQNQKNLASKSLLLDVPPKSLGFYVIPNINAPICNYREDNQHAFLYRNLDNQYKNVPESDMEKEAKKIATLDALSRAMESELLSHEEYIKHPAEWRRMIHGQISEPNNVIFNSNNNQLPEDVKRVIIERAKQQKAMEMEEKSKHIEKILLERAQNEETKAKLLSDIEKLKANEIEQAIDDLIDRKNEEQKVREKRNLVTSNEDLSWMQINEDTNVVPRLVRRIQNNLANRMPLDPVYENEEENTPTCDCIKRRGKCNCKNNNLLLKQMLQLLNNDQNMVQNKIETYEESTPIMKLEEINEMKNLVNEMKSIVTTMKTLETKNKHKAQGAKKANDDMNDIIKVNLIPKERLKRLSEETNNDVIDEPTSNIMKKMNLKVIRKKRSPPLMKDLKQLKNEIIKVGTTSEPEKEKIDIMKEELKIEKKPEYYNENTDIKSDSDLQFNAKYKSLQRKLKHQEKLENQIEHYLQKIRQSKIDLREELEKTAYNTLINGSHMKKHIKREIWESNRDESSIDNKATINIQENNTLDSGEHTKEVDMFLNEISKEGKSLPNFLKEKEEATYVVKLKPKKKIHKIIKMFEEESKEKSIESLRPKIKPILKTSTEKPSTSKDDDDNTEVFHDVLLHYDETTTSLNEDNDNNTDGFVNGAFKTLSECLSDFHKKIIDFLKFLNP